VSIQAVSPLSMRAAAKAGAVPASVAPSAMPIPKTALPMFIPRSLQRRFFKNRAAPDPC
jgi:hypothetical protein